MPGKETSKKIAVISGSVFLFFILLFCFFSFLASKGIIGGEIRSMAVQSVLLFIGYLPLFVFLFFLGRVFRYKPGYWQNAYKLLNFISIGLFLFSLIQVLLAVLGVFG